MCRTPTRGGPDGNDTQHCLRSPDRRRLGWASRPARLEPPTMGPAHRAECGWLARSRLSMARRCKSRFHETSDGTMKVTEWARRTCPASTPAMEPAASPPDELRAVRSLIDSAAPISRLERLSATSVRTSYSRGSRDWATCASAGAHPTALRIPFTPSAFNLAAAARPRSGSRSTLDISQHYVL
jgi:hypothetical protein